MCCRVIQFEGRIGCVQLYVVAHARWAVGPGVGEGMPESSSKCFLASVSFMSAYSTRCFTWVRT
jgi:hypothetical protein